MVELPPFKLWLAKDAIAVGSDVRWTSAWSVDRSEPIGGERSVFYWLHAMQQRSRVDAVHLGKMYWSVRDDGGCFPGRPFSLGDVAAGVRRDVQPHTWMFAALADASWCQGCKANPKLLGEFCVWCAQAPISEIPS